MSLQGLKLLGTRIQACANTQQGSSTINPRDEYFTVASFSADNNSHVQKVLPRTVSCIYLYFK